jgi:hypothetical protein
MNVVLLRVDLVYKSLLISESGMETQINVHPLRENLTTRHMHGL